MGQFGAQRTRQPYFIIGFMLLAVLLFTAANADAAPQITKCNDCHGMPPKDGTRAGNPAFQADVSATLGSHQKHLSVNPVIANHCVVCHGGTAITATDHQNDVINMAASISSGTYGKGVFFNQTSIPLLNSTATCSSVSCHADPYSAGSITTPIWGTAAANCSACHTTAIGATGPATGSHSSTVGHAVVCTTCHNSGTSATTMPSTGHIDTTITVVNVGYPANVVKHAAGSGYSTCSTASCHLNVYGSGSVVTPVWGVSAGCSACHSVTIDATGPATGSHVKHNDSTCTDCHNTGTTQSTKPTNGHADGNIDVTNGYPATVAKHAAGSYTGTCSTASCHADVYGSGTIVTPVWGVAAANCAACHTTPIAATGPNTGSHASHNYTDCSLCHTGATTSAALPAANHRDGDIDVNSGYPANVVKHTTASGFGGRTCSAATCHANVYGTGTAVTPVWGTTAGCSACHTTPILATGPATGSHAKHNDPTCTDCHNVGTTATTVPSTGHADGDIDVTNGYPANVAKHTTASGFGTSTCSTASCHANVYGTGTVTTPVWGATAANCTACHTTAIAATGPATGSHAKHNVTDCSQCHTGATTSAAVPSLNHADGDIDVNSGYPANVAKHTTASGFGARTCSAATCHANVYGTGSVATPVWGAAAANCTACHTTPIATTGPATGSHATHNVTDCSQCHTGATTSAALPTSNHIDGDIDVNSGYPVNVAKHTTASGFSGRTCSAAACHADVYSAGSVTTPAWGTTGGCSSCHTTPITTIGPATGSHVKHNNTDCSQCHTGATTSAALPTSNHIDGDIDVNSGYPANVVKHLTASGFGGRTCSAASCHANVYGAGNAVTPAWGVSSGCSACHAATPIGATGPATGSHVVHNDGTCTHCHAAGTTATTVPGTLHANGSINATNGYPVTAKHLAGTYAGTCSTAICHGQGAPTWGATSATQVNGFPYSATQCGKCHSESGTVTVGTPFYSTAIPKMTLSTNAKVGAHTAHLISKENIHSALVCTDCHGAVALNDPTHMNGSTNFSFGTLAKTGNLTPQYNSTTGQCSNVYCHGGAMPGGDTSGSNRTPTWSDPNYLPTTLTVAGCGTCHGFPPPTSVGHPAVSIPVGFPSATVSIGTTCSCHSNINPAGNSYANMFVDITSHINGKLEGGACNACHGYPPVSPTFVGAGTQNNWSSARVEDYVGGGGAHTINGHVSKLAKHNDGFAYCNKCHSSADHATNKLYEPSTSIKVSVNPRYRFEAAKQFKYTSNRVDGNSHVTGNCSNSSCHFGASPKWDPLN